MSADLFQFLLEGNLGTTPQLRHTQNGKPVTDFRIAINRSYVNADNERVDNTNWYKITVWGRQAETCAQYLTKGRRVRVHVGRIGSEAWIAPNPETGANEIAHRAVLHASRVDFLPGGARTDMPSYNEDAEMDTYAASMGYEEEIAPPVAPVPAAKNTTAKNKSRRATGAAAPVPVPAGADTFGDFGPDDVPF